MKSNEFAYWLQGFFELGGGAISVLNNQQCIILKKHLEMVFKYEKTPSSFCLWLKGFLDSADIACGDPAQLDLDEDFINLIKAELHKIFKHEIDLTYGNSAIQNELNHIHNNQGNGKNNSELLRC